MSVGMRHPPRTLALVAVLALILAACGGGATAGQKGELRATVEVEYPGLPENLEFRPGEMQYGPDTWATHQVAIQSYYDGRIQTFSLFNRYRVRSGELVPAPGAERQEYRIFDGREWGTFRVEILEAPPVGTLRARLAVPIHIEPFGPERASVTEEDITLTVEFVYEVFWAETPLVAFCARADQLLWETSPFTPQKFIEVGEGVLTPDQVARFEEAIQVYKERAARLELNPNDFFDLVEEICDAKYNKRWIAMA